MLDRIWNTKRCHSKVHTTWRRLGCTLVLLTCYGMAETLLLLVVGWQAIAMLLGGGPHDDRVRVLGGQLSGYIYQIFLYLTCNSTLRPFPFSPWPRGLVPPP
ncbi:MAG: DUF4389 domain-containing protein [Magnetococcus sp. MYC-9]